MERCYTYLLIPLALLLLLPLVLLLACAIYFLALFHAVRVVVLLLFGRQIVPDIAMQKPHFIERQTVAERQNEDRTKPGT